MNDFQKSELRNQKRRHEFLERYERETGRHKRRMSDEYDYAQNKDSFHKVRSTQSLPRVAVAWTACLFICASCAIVFSGALIAILANCGC